MKDLKDVTALVYDHGLFISVAERLARDCKRVLYFSDWEEGFSTVNKAVMGDGLETVERCLDIWPIKDEVDLWVFPDIQHSGLQVELESQGFPVWGAKKGDKLELNREYFLDVLKATGLDVPSHHVAVGITKLREYLRHKENAFVKISKYRGSLETKHWRSWDLDENLLDLWALRFGACREEIRFLVFDAIDTPIEIGGDTYNVHGQWPETMIHGIEAKDQAYLGAVTAREDMPEQVQDVLDAFGPKLKKFNYANQWSMEIRVLDGMAYFIDPTCRGGLPSTGSQEELWSNFSEIIWAGAHGELVEPVPTAEFSAELIVKAKVDAGLWPVIEMPPQLQRWLKLNDCMGVEGGKISWPREDNDGNCAGWLVAIGDTPAEALEAIKTHLAILPEGLSADIAPLADVIKEIEIAEQKGIEFSDKAVPDPGDVVA